MNKRRNLLFGCVALAAGLTWSALVAGTVDLTVLQSTDLHGSPAVAKYAKWIAAERAADPELLLVDCGDLCNGTFATWIDGGASMVSYLNLCQYDVWVPGNHEFRIGNENFKRNLSLFTAGSVLAANVLVDDPARKPSVPILPWKLFTKKGVRIAVIGMASHRSDDWYDVKPYRGLRLLSPVQALKEVMPAVRAAKPDVIAVAMHSDLSQGAETETGNENWVDAKEVYAAYPEIVLFFEGHTHREVSETEFAPGRWIVQPRDNGGSMAKVRIAFDTASRKVTRVTSEFVEAKKLPATDDAHMPEVWRKNNAEAEVAAKTPIVHLPDEYVWRAKEKKGGLPPTLVAEAMREAAGSDAAIVSQGGQLRPTTADLTEKFFFGLQKSGFSVLTLDPDQLKKALAASGRIEGRSVGIDPEKLPTKPITVAFDAYDLTGCDGERMGLRELARSGVPRREVEINLREAVRAYMTKRWPAVRKHEAVGWRPFTVLPLGIGMDRTTEEVAKTIRAVKARAGVDKVVLHAPGHGVRTSGYFDEAGYRGVGRRVKAVQDAVRKDGVEVGFLMGPTMNVGINHPWTKFVMKDGKVRPFTACPGDPAFRKAFAAHCAAVAEECRPFLYMMEDDFRLFWGTGCYCERHKANPTQAFEDLVLLAQEAAKAIHRVSPKTRIGLSAPGGYTHEAARLARVLADGGKPFIRWYGSEYGFDNPMRLPDFLWTPIWCKQHLSDGMECVYEADAAPNTAFYGSGARVAACASIMLANGFDGLWYWLTGIGGTETGDPLPNLDTYERCTGDLASVAACAREGRPVGLSAMTAPAGRLLARYGIPYKTTAGGVEFYAGAEAFAGKSDDEIRKILAGRVLLDGDAALALTTRGFAKEIGAKASERVGAIDFVGECVCAGRSLIGSSYHANYGMDGAEVRRLEPVGGEEISYYYSGAVSNRVQSSVTRHTNALGGKIVVMAACLADCTATNLLNFRKRDLFLELIAGLGGEVPVRTDRHVNVLVFANESAERLFVHATQLSCQPVGEMPFVVAPAWRGGRVELLEKGAWKPVGDVGADGRVTIARPTHVYDTVSFRVFCDSVAGQSNVRGHENVEWSIAYAFHLTDAKKDLPRVLLVGDSICNGYQEGVQKLLDGRVNVSYWISSYCVTSPGYLKLLAFYLDEAKYDVVHFNNGLHTPKATTVEAYTNALAAALALIREKQPQARLVWATSTPLADADKTARVRELNAAARPVAEKAGCRVDDLFALLDPMDRAANWSDVYHHRASARKLEAEQVAASVLAALPGRKLYD